ncbi:Zinc finger and BTB domain-containing protein 22, partial [Frankliniella fusca]
IMENKQYFLCVHCNPYKYLKSFGEMKVHFNKRHTNLTSFSCGQCRNKFTLKSSLMRHIEYQHIKKESQTRADNNSSSSESTEDENLTVREARHIEIHIHKENESSTSSSDGEEMNDESDENNQDNEFNNDQGNQEGNEMEGHQATQDLDFQTEAAKFLLRLRAPGNMTNTSIQMIVENVSQLLKNIMLKAKEDTRTFLYSTEVPPNNTEEFLKGGSFSTDTIFEGLQSVDDQLEFFSRKFGLVIPEELYLNSRIENRFNSALRMFIATQVNETFQYVSLIETLKLILRNDFLRNLILSEKNSEDGVYRSYRDGTDFANNQFLRKYPHALRIVLYYDGLEISNALGSKDVIHSLGCFYFSIQNLPPEESSRLSSIFLLALCYAQDLKKPGAFATVLAKFVAELKLLLSDEGVELDLPNEEKFVLRACLCTLTADTLAAHEMLGFFSSSDANRFCRICMISKENLKESTTFIGTLRSSQQHEQHVQEVERRPAAASLFGVKERSILSQVMRVPEDTVFDVFHDMVGVTQMILKLVLYEFIMVQKFFSVSQFNENINSFVYGKPDIKNKPSATFTREKLSSKGHTLKQYGSQTFCLLRVFPFLIRGVDENNRYLQLVFLLQDILRIVFSFEVKASDVDRLQALLYEFGTKFHEIFILPGPVREADDNINNEVDEDENESGNEGEEEEEEEEGNGSDNDPDDPLLPNRRRRRVWKSRQLKKAINKMHHIMHYPDQIREKGPIIRLWCARYEGRHRLIRKHSAVQCNFKNPPKTMARMFQLSTLAAFLDRTSSHADNVTLSGGATVLVRYSPYRAQLMNEGLQEDSWIKTVECAQICGEEYQSGLFVILRQNNAVQPVFAIIVNVLADTSDPTRVFLVVNKCLNTTFCARYHAYRISNKYEETNLLVNVKDLANHRTIAPWNPLDHGNNMGIFLSPRTLSI